MLTEANRDLISPKNNHLYPRYQPIAISVIDANENRDVATTNILGTYLNADMDNIVAMKIRDDGRLCDHDRHSRILQARADIQ